VQNGEVGTEAARERHGAIAGMARGLGEIDRTEDVLDVDHGYLQSGRGADAGDPDFRVSKGNGRAQAGSMIAAEFRGWRVSVSGAAGDFSARWGFFPVVRSDRGSVSRQ
jgi:hypothetical protein